MKRKRNILNAINRKQLNKGWHGPIFGYYVTIQKEEFDLDVMLFGESHKKAS